MGVHRREAGSWLMWMLLCSRKPIEWVLGIVVRDQNGDFLVAYRQGVDNITDPEVAEAVAFRRAITFILEMPFKQVIIASDCLSLIVKLRRVVKDRSHIAIIIQDIRSQLSHRLMLFSLLFM